MGDLRPASEASEASTGYGSGGVGLGAAALDELERVRANLYALAELYEALRTKYNAHTHNGAVAAPPAGEQQQTAFTLS